MKPILTVLILCLYQCQESISTEGELIDLRGRILSNIPKSLFKNTKIKELHIGTTGYVVYPPCALLPSQRIPLTDIPEKISVLQELTRLSITASKIKKLPNSIRALKKLHYLDISFNERLNIQEEVNKINEMKNLDTLVAYGRLLNGKMKADLIYQNPKLIIIDEETLMSAMKDKNLDKTN